MRRSSDIQETIRDGWKKSFKAKACSTGNLDQGRINLQRDSSKTRQVFGRSSVAIRNLRYKKHLVARAEDETKALFQQRDELSNIVEELAGREESVFF